ncbi:MAG: 3'-5' exonuclease [Chloroflexi bacterium]|nr:3'-5' exonuclease [Chloroflexota bacterium]
MRFENGQKVAEIDQLLQPERRMDPGASRVNGIDDEDLLGQPTFAQIAPDLTRLLDGALLLAHNAAFDAGFLGVEYAIYGTSRQPHTAVPANPWLCTLLLARQHLLLWPQQPEPHRPKVRGAPGPRPPRFK